MGNPTILGAIPGAIHGIDRNPHERFSFAPAFSERFFKNWGGPRDQDLCNRSARNWNINSLTINVCNWRVHRKYLMKAPNYTKEFLPESAV